MGKKADQQKPPTRDEELAEGHVFEAADLAPVIEGEAKLIVPKKGKLFEERDGMMVGRVAVIRPCLSRGARIRGYPPIYEASMLAQHAGVFSGWPMFADHALAEALAEKLQEKGRSIRDLGGRLLKTWFDPELVFEDDDSFGYRKGGVVGEYVPQPFIREMLEADPGVIQASINAWPSRARIGAPSWDNSKRGAVIEGIASKPQGSVDWVPRGGAGGRPLALTEEDRELAVTILESTYPSRREGPTPEEPHEMKKLSEMSQAEIKALSEEQLKEALEKEGLGHLAESFVKPAPSNGNGNGGTPAASITMDDLKEALAEQRSEIESDFEKKLKEGTTERLTEAETFRHRESLAGKFLAEAVHNGFPQAWADHLRPRYAHLPSGPGDGIKLAEADFEDGDGGKLTEEEAIREAVKRDVGEALKLIEASSGSAPRVEGFSPAAEETTDGKDGGKPKLREGDEFTEFLVESGDLTGDREKDGQRLNEMLGLEGVH